MAKQNTLGKEERLKSRKAIDQLFNGGKSFVAGTIRVYHTFPAADEKRTLQFGVGVSTRHFKKAVDRNKIKRLMRESWRLQKVPVSKILKEQNRALNVFFIYTGKEIPGYHDIHERTGKIIERICKMMLH